MNERLRNGFIAFSTAEVALLAFDFNVADATVLSTVIGFVFAAMTRPHAYEDIQPTSMGHIPISARPN